MEDIGKILPKVLKPQLACLEPPVVEVLAPLWIQVAGKTLAKQCRPVAFSGGTLTLATDDADWAAPLQQVAEEIRAQVNNFLGKPVVRRLRISRLARLDRGDRPPRWPENLLASKTHRKDWRGKVPGAAPGLTQVKGRPSAKSVGRKPGKAA